MKKLYLFLILLIFPFIAHAEVDYDITDYYITSDIEVAGGLKIKELVVLDGTFNGYERNIVYRNDSLEEWKAGNVNFEKSSIYNAVGIDNLKVAAMKVNGDVSFDTMKNISNYASEVDSANLGESNVYTTTKNSNGIDVRMYMPANNEKVAFYLEYVVANAVVMHNDVAELYFPFIGDKFSDDIDNVNVQVFLPAADTSNNFRIWAHGPLSGEINKYQNENKENIGLIASIKDLKANTGFDIRVTFDKSLILVPQFLHHSNEDALDKILEVENKRADDANAKRKKIKAVYYSIKYAAIGYLIFLIVMWIYIYVKFDKEYKADFKNKYNREFIDDYNVEVIDYLFNKNITPNAMSASIMNLVYKKNISVEEMPSDKKKKEYTFKLLNKENLSKSEEYLIEFLFDTVGNGSVFTTKKLKDYAKSTSSYSTFTSKYSTWKNNVIQEGQQQNFYESNTKIKFIGLIIALIGGLIFVTNILCNTDILIAYALIIPIVIFAIYIMTFNRRTKNGNEDYAKWKAFKNFLNDFGTFDIKELPEITLWERYMVYATIFGLAKKVQKSMNVYIQELDPNGTLYPYYYNSWMYYDLNYAVADSVNSAVNSAVNYSINTANANSSYSSGSGFGGGFSSGGGGGFGGGGGGHGF
ncbi:MAG TPA: DUF2207 domain-containing protein [Bacilli bacterium]|nr:DUF2207 domain-containing protein [Bacilli bacterium]